jgi:AcrR family transcriptional regulator
VRAKRRDAAQNRERILDVAERLFVTEGLEVGFHRIAGELGVGVGTVYRHFPARDELFLGVYERYQQHVEDVGEQFLETEPGMARVLLFIDGVIGFALLKPFSRRIAARVQQRFPEKVAVSRWAVEVAAAVETAKAAGDLRPDADLSDIAVLAGMVADLATIEEPRRSIVMPRMRAYVLDSLRPVGAERPRLSEDALSMEDITAITHQHDRD